MPYNAIAKAAGVGQGVLYRHFPRRVDLALAVFDDNFTAMQRLADATPGAECFTVVWRRLVADTVASTAFIDMVIDLHPQLPDALGENRLAAILEGPLARAQAAGQADPTWTMADILLFIHMVHGVVIGQAARADAPAAVARALSLIDPRLAA